MNKEVNPINDRLPQERAVKPTLKSGATHSKAAGKQAPSVFDYTDFREYLKSFIEFRKSANTAYSASAFVRKAGLGANSRGYLKLVVDGKRNLTPQTVRSFSEACEHDSKASIYFENLVFFNQAEKPQDKKYYFERLVASADRADHKPIQVLESQWRFFNHWYITAIRELVNVKGFKEDGAWIAKALRSKITSVEARRGLQDLLNLGLLQRDPETNVLYQSEPLIRVAGGIFNPFIHHFHLGMIERAKESLNDDHYQERHASGVTLSIAVESLPKIVNEVSAFRSLINEKYGVSADTPNAVVQVNVQVFQLTQPSYVNQKIDNQKTEESKK